MRAVQVDQGFCYYESNDGGTSAHGLPVVSGAYIFSPNGTASTLKTVA